MRLTDLVFGLRVHQTFPTKFLISSNCGNGFWRTNGNGDYPDGVMLEEGVHYPVSYVIEGLKIYLL